jgi:hypothetical protein
MPPSGSGSPPGLGPEQLAAARHIGLGLEPHHVEGGDPAREILAFGQRVEIGEHRERDVEEQPDPRRHALRPQHRGQRQEVVVVDPDKVVRPRQRATARATRRLTAR